MSEGEELPCERNDDGRCDVCSNCFKHIRLIGYDDGKDEARRDFTKKIKKHILERIEWLEVAIAKSNSAKENIKWLNRERELTFLFEWLEKELSTNVD